MTEAQWTARHYHELGMEYDFQRHQMRIAELYYRKSYEILKMTPRRHGISMATRATAMPVCLFSGATWRVR